MSLSDDIQALYHLNGDATDSSGNNYDGSLVGATFNSVNQKLGSAALSVDGIDDRMDINPVAVALASNTVGSWGGWARPVDATPASFLRILAFSRADNNHSISLFITPTATLRAQFFDGATQWDLETDDPVFADNTWGNPGISQDGVEPVLYFNGVPPAQTFLTSVDKTKWLNDFTSLTRCTLGALNDSAGPRFFFKGLLDEWFISDVDKPASEFLEFNNGGAGKQIGISSNSFLMMGV